MIRRPYPIDLPAHCRVAIVGGGISGLAAAHRLVETGSVRGTELVLVEREDRIGGQVRTLRTDPYLLEAGPDTMVTQKPAGLALCRRLGLEPELIRPYRGEPTVHVLRHGRVHRVPDGFSLVGPTRLAPLLASGLFGPAAKIRMIAERFLPPVPPAEGDESLRSFVTRRYGRAAFERVAEPIVGGLFTADADRLSMQLTLPRFLDLEAQSGSVWRGLSNARNGTTGSAAHEPVALRGGMQQLVDRLEQRLTGVTIATRTAARSLARADAGGWLLELETGQVLRAEAVVLACPGFVAARLLRSLAPRLADRFGELDYASCATINLVYRRGDVADRHEGFGFFVPRTEGIPLLACSYVSRKFPDRAPADRLVLRAYVGGALHAELPALEDRILVARVHALLQSLLGITRPPSFARVHRHPQAMPQYVVGDLARVRDIERLLADQRGLFVCGGSLDAIGLPDCIRSGERAADRVDQHLERRPRARRIDRSGSGPALRPALNAGPR
ncbi:MAG TPA: protoporphyrinogen oxidase [Candidatus Polarisedimenticolaceae bacterium]|nr:protoporphyrinogen oxidase [Candidatus Polarisedimenticolaceae bacterium]